MKYFKDYVLDICVICTFFFGAGDVRALIINSLDRERTDSYVITVTARDNAGSDPSGLYDRKYGN